MIETTEEDKAHAAEILSRARDGYRIEVPISGHVLAVVIGAVEVSSEVLPDGKVNYTTTYCQPLYSVDGWGVAPADFDRICRMLGGV